MKKILDVKGLSTCFYNHIGSFAAVSDISFYLREGETLAFVGESGGGKSMMGLSLMNMTPPSSKITEGHIFYRGEDLLSKEPSQMEKIRGSEISMIFQEPYLSLNPVLKIGTQFASVLASYRKMPRKLSYHKALNLLEKVEVPSPENVLNSYPYELSGGICQRVMIAMAIAKNPKILIADEPTACLDTTTQTQILRLLKGIQRESQMAMILITHDFGVVAQTAERIIVIYAGEAVEEGTREDILKSPRHPYTKGLLKSIPDSSKDCEKLYTIDGIAPSPLNYPLGCRFAPRCLYARRFCRLNKPNSFVLSETHRVRCLRYKEEL